jgi:anti-sigma factor RsiW
MKHVLDRIQACLDGELEPIAAAAVREHCDRCPACGRVWRELEAVWAVIASAPEPSPSRPVWPAVRARLTAPVSRWWRLSYVGGAVAATAAGLLLGLWFGHPATAQDSRGPQVDLLAISALLEDGGERTLDGLYLAAGASENEAMP